jgi:hypothetical protein
MNETRRESNADCDGFFRFEPISAIQADRAHRSERASFSLDNGSPLF